MSDYRELHEPQSYDDDNGLRDSEFSNSPFPHIGNRPKTDMSSMDEPKNNINPTDTSRQNSIEDSEYSHSKTIFLMFMAFYVTFSLT